MCRVFLARYAVVRKIDAAHKRGDGKDVGQKGGEQKGADARPARDMTALRDKGRGKLLAEGCLPSRRSATSRLPPSSNRLDRRPAASCDACDP